MDIFSSKKSYIGIDLGTSAIKMVELQKKNNRAVLLTYGYVEQSTDIIRASSEEMETKIVDVIRDTYSKSRMSSRRVIAALPSFSVFNSIITLPAMNKKDLAQAIKWEAKKFIPLPIDEMTLDWKIIPEKVEPKKHPGKKKATEGKKDELEKNGDLTPAAPASNQKNGGKADKKQLEPGVTEEGKEDPEKKEKFSISELFKKGGKLGKGGKKDQKKAGKNTKILLTAAPKNLVERYIRIFKAADLELLSLETEAFALERSLLGGDPSSVMVIDIGAVSSDVTVIDNGIPILTRSIDVGGSAITKAVMTSLNVDISRAEQFKRDIGFSATGPGDLPEIIKATLNPIVNEVKYSLDIYLSQAGGNKSLEKIILTGGSAYLPELVNYLSKLLDIKVIIGDPWDRVVYPLELKPVLQELGPRFSVAVGLAMREI
jgi:Tfp pilus assembly PilM family ATPase